MRRTLLTLILVWLVGCVAKSEPERGRLVSRSNDLKPSKLFSKQKKFPRTPAKNSLDASESHGESESLMDVSSGITRRRRRSKTTRRRRRRSKTTRRRRRRSKTRRRRRRHSRRRRRRSASKKKEKKKEVDVSHTSLAKCGHCKEHAEKVKKNCLTFVKKHPFMPVTAASCESAYAKRMVHCKKRCKGKAKGTGGRAAPADAAATKSTSQTKAAKSKSAKVDPRCATCGHHALIVRHNCRVFVRGHPFMGVKISSCDKAYNARVHSCRRKHHCPKIADKDFSKKVAKKKKVVKKKVVKKKVVKKKVVKKQKKKKIHKTLKKQKKKLKIVKKVSKKASGQAKKTKKKSKKVHTRRRRRYSRRRRRSTRRRSREQSRLFPHRLATECMRKAATDLNRHCRTGRTKCFRKYLKDLRRCRKHWN